MKIKWHPTLWWRYLLPKSVQYKNGRKIVAWFLWDFEVWIKK